MPSRTELVTLLLAASRVVGLRVQAPTVSRRDAGSAVRRAADCQMSAPGGRRVVVTGMGIVSCLGNSLDDVSASLKEAKSGIKVNQKYIDIGMKSHICGRPEINLDEFIDRKQARFMGVNAK